MSEVRAPTPRLAVVAERLPARRPEGPRKLPSLRHPRRFSVSLQALAGVWPDVPGGDWIEVDESPWYNLVITASELEHVLEVWHHTRWATRIEVDERQLDGTWRTIISNTKVT